jgi:type IV secretory pathway VirJ component
VNRLSADVARQLLVYLMISPDETCDFEIHLSDMLNLGISKGGFDVMKEIQSGKFKRITAIFGSDENEEVRKLFQQSGLTVEILEGDHHFNSGYQALADLIVTEMKRE